MSRSGRLRRVRIVVSVLVLALLALAAWVTWDPAPAGPPLASGTQAPGDRNARMLEQGWSANTVESAWHTSFGSRLLPRNWFLALERVDGDSLFRAPDYLAGFGFLRQDVDAANPDGLPVGLAITVDGTHVGFTCAACHTGELSFRGQRWRIVGGAGMIDISTFEAALLQALQATASDQAKFARFSARVGDAQLHDQLAARIHQLEQRTRINRVEAAYGPGRMDAFGQIFNAVSAEFLGQPDNFHAPDAPVSIPSLWNTPRLDRVQWNGSSPNASIAPLVQNVTTALAVYGDADLRDPGVLGYRSSVDLTALGQLQRWNTQLRSPQWPEQGLGKLDHTAIARGQSVYRTHCARCHAEATRTETQQALATVLVPLGAIGTDPRMAENFADRQVDAGALAGRHAMVWGGAPLQHQARAIDLVVHAALGATLQHPLLALRAAFASHGSAAATDSAELRVYKAAPLAGIWATAPYLHNGSVPTLYDLLQTPDQRPSEFVIGSHEFDPAKIGLAASDTARGWRFDTHLPGNHNSGHIYGTALDAADKADLLEFLKSL